MLALLAAQLAAPASAAAAANDTVDLYAPATATAPQDLDVPLAPAMQGCRVVAIGLVGLQRTVAKVVRRELTVAVGAPLAQPALRESVRRLRNLGVFRRVDFAVAPVAALAAPGAGADATRCTLTLRFDEKWTLLPIFSLGRGGGILFLTAGVQDSHLLGRLLTVEGFWQYFGGVHSAGIVFADPRLADRRIHLGVSAALLRRNRARFADDGAPLAGWSRHRWQLAVDVEDLRDPDRTWRAAVFALDDRFDVALLPAPDRAAARALGLPSPQRWLAASLGGRLGRIDRDDYLERGAFVDAAALAAVAGPASEAKAQAPVARGTLTLKGALLPWGRLNLVGRVQLSAISRHVDELGLYVGGLDGVRGLPDSRYRGDVAAVVNAEARLSAFHGRWLALQPVAFVDVGHAATGWRRLFAGVVPASFGTGVRVIVPRVARLVARIDAAFTPSDGGGWLLSFGAQQAF